MANIDVFTNKGGQGQNATSPGYIPQELVLLYAYVTYQGAPVGNKEVVFTVIDPHQNIISVMSALTNETGYASTQYRTPWFNNGTTDFGIWQSSGISGYLSSRSKRHSLFHVQLPRHYFLKQVLQHTLNGSQRNINEHHSNRS